MAAPTLSSYLVPVRRAAWLLVPALGLGLLTRQLAVLVGAPDSSANDLGLAVSAVLAGLAVVRRTFRTGPDPVPSRDREPEMDSGQGRVRSLEGSLRLAATSEFDFQRRLLPELTDLARHRLWSRRGIDLDREPQRAAAVIGSPAWDQLRPDRERRGSRRQAGVPLPELEQLVTALERI